MSKPRIPEETETLEEMFGDLAKWETEHAEEVSYLGTLSKEQLGWMLKWALCRLDQSQALVREQNDLLDKYVSLLPASELKGRMQAAKSAWLAVMIESGHVFAAYRKWHEVTSPEGRKKGSETQKEKAEKTNERIQALNAALLKDPRMARWTLDDRAESIEKLLLEEGIKQLNGKPYKASTIKNKITGT